LDSLDLNNIDNMASELLEFEDDDEPHGGNSTPNSHAPAGDNETPQTKPASVKLVGSKR
jgi:hypothetical protein